MKIELILKSPLAHGAFGDENLGNYSAFRRLPIIVNGKAVSIPVVSGNALRGKMRREIMREMYKASEMSMEKFIAEFGMTKSKRAWDRLYAALFGGGTIDNVDVNINTGALREIREKLPPLSLFGSALYSVLMPGMMNIGFCFPVCHETISAGLCEGESGIRAAELIEDIGLTRHIDRENANPEETGVKPMPYQVECMIPGVKMQAEIDFEPMATEIEKHCAAHAVKLLHTIGGKQAVGFGKIKMLNADADDSLYLQWLEKDHLEYLIELAKQVI